MPFRYVYVLVSTNHPDRHHVGISSNLKARLAAHNQGEVALTAKHAPWELANAIAFRTEKKALLFARFLKSTSGRAFCQRHFGLKTSSRRRPT